MLLEEIAAYSLLPSTPEADKKLVHDTIQRYKTYTNAIFDVSNSNDDVLWWVLAFEKSYEVTQDPHFLSLAEHSFNHVYTRDWTSTCQGGLLWAHDKSYKNAITNELLVTAATTLHAATGNETYLGIAVKAYSWFSQSGMVDERGLFVDGLDDDCGAVPQKLPWTYNQGVLLSGLTKLYAATGDAKYQEAAENLFSAVKASDLVTEDGILVESCESDDSGCSHDGAVFKGIFARHLQYAGLAGGDEFLDTCAASLVEKDTAGDGKVGVAWTGPYEDPGENECVAQLSAFSLLNAVERSKAAALLKSDQIDETWSTYLEEPPEKAASLAEKLASRADDLTKGMLVNSRLLSPFDVVCSGGGDLNAYYIGAEMIIKRLRLPERRHRGASAGGWMSLELALKKEQITLENYLSYGVLQEENPLHFSNIAFTVNLQDHHWRMMGDWQSSKWEENLSSMDNKVFLALSCKEHWWQSKSLLMVSEYTSPEQASSAFIGTGAISEEYEGMSCSDGSENSGKDMTPLFQDNKRQQLVINLMKVEGKVKTAQMGFGKYTSDDYASLVQRGQDEMIEFLQSGVVSRDSKAITLCDVGSDVSTNVCRQK